jgi:hypothetical protein
LLVLGHTKRDTLSVPEFWRDQKLLKHGDSVMRFLAAARDTQDAASEEIEAPFKRHEEQG